MKVSLKIISQFIDLPKPVDIEKLCHEITMRTVEVEGYEDLAAGLDSVIVARVQDAQSIPDSRNQLVTVDTGNSHSKLICGASNVEIGTLVAVARPGAKAKKWVKKEGLSRKSKTSNVGAQPSENDRELIEFRVSKQKIGDYESDGMLCAAFEIGLDNLFPDAGERDIIILPDDLATPGTPLATALEWDDLILDIDNKSITNRPDLWGHYGMAREFAAALKTDLKPLPKMPDDLPDGQALNTIDPDLCRKFGLLEIDLGETRESPIWLKSALARIDSRPINFYTDLSNYVMFITGQPCHAYDAASVQLPMSARRGTSKDTLEMINGAEVTLTDLPVITDANGVLGAAGVMGGRASAIKNNTRAVLWEAATFARRPIRRSAAYLAQKARVDSEASKRFDKGIDTGRVEQALALTIDLIQRFDPRAKIKALSLKINDETRTEPIAIEIDYINKRLGTELKPSKIVSILNLLGFEVEANKYSLTVTPPIWRSTGDVSGPHDLIEEVARGEGYEKFARVSPKIPIDFPNVSKPLSVERRISEYLAFQAGFYQIVTYPWPHPTLIENCGFETDHLLMIEHKSESGARWPLRPSLIPGVISSIKNNVPPFSEFAIFESGAVFSDDLPGYEQKRLCAAIVGKDAEQIFFRMLGVLEDVTVRCQLEPFELVPESAPIWADPASSVAIVLNEEEIGQFGLLNNRAKRLFGLEQTNVAIVELKLGVLTPLPARTNSYDVDWRKDRASAKDISLIFPDDTPWHDIVDTVTQVSPGIADVRFIDEYRGKGIETGSKSITLRVLFNLEAKQSKEAAEITQQVRERLKTKLGGVER